MTATSTGPWYEVQGLCPCPSQPCPDTCPVPPEGEWLPIYFLSTEGEMKAAYNHVLDSDDPMYDRYEDFRKAAPSAAALKRQDKGRRLRVA